jgi:multicomponent Na+:H+ antiporter subunit E
MITIFIKLWRLIGFTLYFSWELMLSNFRVAYDVIRPLRFLKPGVIAVPLDLHTDAEITLLANLVTLTPGTLSLDVSDDRKVLYIHAMRVEDGERVRGSIKHGFERRIQGITR